MVYCKQCGGHVGQLTATVCGSCAEANRKPFKRGSTMDLATLYSAWEHNRELTAARWREYKERQTMLRCMAFTKQRNREISSFCVLVEKIAQEALAS